ncbi:glycosyl hydrolases family 18-domain-containing protein [Blastocladiella britannica]|nr:glycosyl hydrolases family 18-domain-containing protein [Blastocladiella britannica]
MASHIATLCKLLALLVLALTVSAQTAPRPSTGNTGAAVAPSAPRSSGGRKNLVFSYYMRQDTGVQPWDTPGNAVTHVIWSFATILQDGTVTLQGPSSPAGSILYSNAVERTLGYMDNKQCNCQGDCLKGELWQMFLLKQKYPHLKTILSVGGWTWSDNFSVAMGTAAGRQRAIDTSIAMAETYGFDGLDIDWEFPGNADKAKDPTFPDFKFGPNDLNNAGQFFKDARTAFDAKGHGDWSLSFAVSGSAWYSGSWANVISFVDYIFVMSYEFQHHMTTSYGGAALMSVPGDDSITTTNVVSYGLQTFAQVGFPKEKIIMGLPLYGNGWNNIPKTFNWKEGKPGFGAPVSEKTATEPTSYSVLLKKFATDGNWIASPDLKRGTVVYYNGSQVWFLDSPDTIRTKTQYLMQQGYGGIMLWNSNQDSLDPNLSLITAMQSVFPIDNSTARATPFCLPSSQTRYCNLHCGYVPPAGISTSKPMSNASQTSTFGGMADTSSKTSAAVESLARGSVLLGALMALVVMVIIA